MSADMDEMEAPPEKPRVRLALISFGGLVVLVALLLKGVLWLSSVSAQVSAAAETPAPPFVDPEWPSQPYAEVQAYFYGENPYVILDTLLKEGGAENVPFREAKKSLTPDQVRRLREILTRRSAPRVPMGCYYPRHAFIFYDTSGKPVAGVEVCFECGTWTESPDGLPEWIDLARLEDLVTELGLPGSEASGQPAASSAEPVRETREERR